MIDVKNEPEKLKDAVKEVFTQVNEELDKIPTASKWSDKKLTQQEGGNGHYVGEIVTLTDEVGMANVTNDKGEITAKYPAIKLSTGMWFSLKHLIRPNLTGFQLKGNFVEDENGKGEIGADGQLVKDENGKPKGKNAKLWVADVDSLFSKEDETYINTQTRNVLELYVMIRDGVIPTNGIQMKFRGTACRPIVATTASPLPNMPYQVGANRVMRLPIWTLE